MSDNVTELRRLVDDADHGEDVRVDRDALDWLLGQVDRLQQEDRRLLAVVAWEQGLVPAPVIPTMAKALGIEMAATTYPPAGPYLGACIEANKEIDRIAREYAERGRALVEAGRKEEEEEE